MSKPLPSAPYRIHSKRGDADCAVAAMATIFRREPGEVLIAASKVVPNVWHSGLFCTQISKVAKRLGLKTKWCPVTVTAFDPEESTGVLWVGHHDTTNEHCVVLIEGWIYEVEHDPVSMWRYDEYMRATNAYAGALLEVLE